MKIREYNSKENSGKKFENQKIRKFQKQNFNAILEIKYSRNIGNKSINKNSDETYCKNQNIFKIGKKFLKKIWK
jgi:hypothetical protein